MKMKLLMESFKKFLNENFLGKNYDHVLEIVFTALEDLGFPPYSWTPVEEIEINGKSYPIRGNFSLTKASPTGGTASGTRKPFYRIAGTYDYNMLSIVFGIKHTEWIPPSHPHRIKTGERFITTHHIVDHSLSSIDDAMGLSDLIRLDYQGLTELFGKE